MKRVLTAGLMFLAIGVLGPWARGAEPSPGKAEVPEVFWYKDYVKAMEAADHGRRMLLVFFYDRQDPQSWEFATKTVRDPAVQERLQHYVCARLPADTKIRIQGQEVRLLEHEGFREMLGRPGIAIIDLANVDTRLYNAVVSVFPFSEKLRYTPEHFRVILELPAGTLTQRTLIYAVRTHPERPASADGQFLPNLAEEAESHSDYQARIRRQGHHFWERRFHRINARLPAGCTSREVCAESWPGENLVEAAVECVRCWRLSSGHWSAVRARHLFFGYDMKRGANGIWYATGIFGGT